MGNLVILSQVWFCLKLQWSKDRQLGGLNAQGIPYINQLSKIY